MEDTENSTNLENAYKPELPAADGAGKNSKRNKLALSVIAFILLALCAFALFIFLSPKHPIDVVASAVVKTADMYENERAKAFLKKASEGGSFEFRIHPTEILKSYAVMLDADAVIKLYTDKTLGKSVCTVEAGIDGNTAASAYLYFNNNFLILASEEFLGGNVYGIDIANLEENLPGSVFADNSGSDYALYKADFESLLDAVKNYSRASADAINVMGLYEKLYRTALEAFKDNIATEMTKINDGETGKATLVTVTVNNENFYASIEQFLRAVSEDEELREQLYYLFDLGSSYYVYSPYEEPESPRDRFESFFTDDFEKNLLDLKASICEETEAFEAVIKFYIKSGYINRLTADIISDGEKTSQMEYTSKGSKGKITEATFSYKDDYRTDLISYAYQNSDTAQNVSLKILSDDYEVLNILYSYVKADKSYVCTADFYDSEVMFKFTGSFEFAEEAMRLTLDEIYYYDGYEQVTLEPDASFTVNKKDRMPAFPESFKDVITMSEEELDAAIYEIQTSVQEFAFKIIQMLG